ncbi:hypothetical protein Tco_0655139 [Tanacetum coccineum]|uniref:Reverse transcriptase domain-containing protein n=1 Tax=Tanacetum coccineum TaxID=301880 RepID=A0ABQ4X656_9ASTR
MIFKVDFEKAYDSVRWDYLDDVLKSFGFGEKWRVGFKVANIVQRLFGFSYARRSLKDILKAILADEQKQGELCSSNFKGGNETAGGGWGSSNEASEKKDDAQAIIVVLDCNWRNDGAQIGGGGWGSSKGFDKKDDAEEFGSSLAFAKRMRRASA